MKPKEAFEIRYDLGADLYREFHGAAVTPVGGERIAEWLLAEGWVTGYPDAAPVTEEGDKDAALHHQAEA